MTCMTQHRQMWHSAAVSDTARAVRDVASFATDRGPHPEGRFSATANGLAGSEILKIAAEIRARRAQGERLCDLTVGDFDARQFPIPAPLRAAIAAALDEGETSYPVANGMPELRRAVRDLYARELGLEYPIDSVLVAGGSRPLIYAFYRTVCDPGDRVVFPVPSWNNHNYVQLVGAVGVPVPCGPARRFLPAPEELADALPGARLLCLNSPLNPSGTSFDPGALRGIGEAVLAENERRAAGRERPLYLLYDQVYWSLRFGGTEHATPPGLLPELARYTVLVDGISKAFAATGLRVGWGVGPVDAMAHMGAFLGHVGAWAPRPEQVATAAFLDDAAAVRAFRSTFTRGLAARLDLLHRGLQEMKAEGLPVDSIAPTGAIYLTARVHPFGRRTPQGAELRSNEDVRRFLLDSAAIAVVPFQAFGAPDEDGWFRLSAGAVGPEEIEAALPRLAGALRSLAPSERRT
jgi:aspartate aminotransferase